VMRYNTDKKVQVCQGPNLPRQAQSGENREPVFSFVKQHSDGLENDTDIYKRLADCQTLNIPKQFLKEISSSQVTFRPKKTGGKTQRRHNVFLLFSPIF